MYAIAGATGRTGQVAARTLTSAGLPAEVATALAEMFAFVASGRITARGDRTERGTTKLDETLRTALGR